MNTYDELASLRITVANAEAALAEAGVTGRGTLADGVRALAAREERMRSDAECHEKNHEAALDLLDAEREKPAANPASGDEKLRRLLADVRSSAGGLESRRALYAAGGVYAHLEGAGSHFTVDGERARQLRWVCAKIEHLLAESPAAAPEPAKEASSEWVSGLRASLSGVGIGNEGHPGTVDADLRRLRDAVLEVAKRVEERR